MQIENTPLAGVKILTPRRFDDDRGFFAETYNRKVLAENGITLDFVQDNHSFSTAAGTVRGLHFQTAPFAQDKLVRCAQGALFDVAVDIRKGSPTYGKWFGVELSFENGRQLLIPAGFAHGFVARVDNTVIAYKCSNFYAGDCEGALLWNDPDIGIDWALNGLEPVLSGKDEIAPNLAGFDSPFTWQEPAK